LLETALVLGVLVLSFVDETVQLAESGSLIGMMTRSARADRRTHSRRDSSVATIASPATIVLEIELRMFYLEKPDLASVGAAGGSQGQHKRLKPLHSRDDRLEKVRIKATL
jgi:hypothetical protein